MPAKIDIPIIFDVDLTVTEEYQQMPLFRKYFSKIQAVSQREGIEFTDPDHYWKRVAALEDMQKAQGVGVSQGISYLERIRLDTLPGGCFEGLTNAELREAAKLAKAAPGLKDGLLALREQYKDAANLFYFFVSVGIKPMIQGFIEGAGLDGVVDGIAAADFYEVDGKIMGISKVVLPFTKTEEVICIIKGKPQDLNKYYYQGQYRFNYANMIVVGDGFTDTAKFSYSKKRLGIPVAVYTKGSPKAFAQAMDTVKDRVDFILPRDYTPGSTTFDYFKKMIEMKLNRKCKPERIQDIHQLRKGRINDAARQADIEAHIRECEECQKFLTKTIVTPHGITEKFKVDIRMTEQPGANAPANPTQHQ